MALTATSGSPNVTVGVTSPKLRATISIELLQASVSAARTTTSVTYELSHATGIWTDPDSNNRMPKDEFPLSDVRFSLVEKNLSDNVPLVDVSAYDFSALKEDSFTFADTFTVAYHHSFTDAFTLDDLSQIDKDFYGNKGNIFTFADIIGLTYNKVFTDSYTVGDVVSVVNTFKRNFTDNVTPGDTSYLDISKIPDDDFVFADSQAKASSKATTDIFSFSDIPSVGTYLPKSDDFSLSEMYLTAITKHVTDAFVLDDATQVNKDYSGNKGNLVAFTDVLSRVLQYKRAFSETLTFTDVPALGLQKKVSDMFSVYDEKPNPLNASTLNAQSFNAQENPVLITTGVGSSDGVGFTEVAAVTQSKALTDSTVVDDTNAILVSKPKTDSFGVSDDSYVSSGVNPSDSISFGDSYERVLSKVLSDAFVLDDAALINKNYLGNKGNLIGLSELVALVTTYKRDISDSVAFNETLDTVFNKNETENITLNELTGVTSSKTLGENFTFNDGYGLQLAKHVTDAFTLDDAALVDKNYIGNKGNIMSLSDLVEVNLIRSNQLGTRNLNTMPFN